MRRVRLNTLLLAIIAALVVAIVAERRRHSGHVAELQMRHAYREGKLEAKGLEWKNEYYLLKGRCRASQEGEGQ